MKLHNDVLVDAGRCQSEGDKLYMYDPALVLLSFGCPPLLVSYYALYRIRPPKTRGSMFEPTGCYGSMVVSYTTPLRGEPVRCLVVRCGQPETAKQGRCKPGRLQSSLSKKVAESREMWQWK
jgi:hypothetical protein